MIGTMQEMSNERVAADIVWFASLADNLEERELFPDSVKMARMRSEELRWELIRRNIQNRYGG